MTQSDKKQPGLDVVTLEKSFALIAPQADRLVERFYAELFRRHPAVRPLFGDTDMRAQRSKLIAALQLVVANVRKPQTLIPALQEMGRRHEKYGAKPEHYQAVAATLLDVMSEIAGPAWTPRVERAWSNALALIAKTMLGAYRRQAGRNNESKEDNRMSIFANLSLRWKLAVAMVPAVGTLLYFAWTANPAIALGAVAVSLLLSIFVKSSVQTSTTSNEELADLTGQFEAINKAQAVIEFNMDGTIVKANDNFLTAMGYSLEEIQGQHHSMFAEPEYTASAEYKQFWEKLNRGEYEAREYKRIGKGGREVWIQASYNPIMDLNGKPFKVVKFATDVTEQKLSNANASGQLDAIGRAQAVIEFNMDGTIITANDNFLTAMGYSLEEIQGQHHSMFAEPEYAASAEYKQFWETLNRGEYEAKEYKRIGKGGREVWIQASYNPIMDLNGKPFKVVKFATDVTKEKLQAIENGVISQAIGNLTANVMVADANLDIMYMNETVGEMFRNAEDDIRKDLPKFEAARLMGTCIDDFHKDPSHQRRMLADLNATFESQLELGGRTFQIIANPLRGANGERLGTVVEWQDLTERLAREEKERLRVEAEQIIAAENGRIKEALNRVNSNVMIGDNDLNIVYMNDTVTELFRDVESDIRKDLPGFNASKLMGTCIDDFHKNPDKQRGMLANLNSTHTAELEIGGRTMKIVANPVFDKDGERLGTVVEWTDRTQELAIEREVQHVVDSALVGDLTKRISLDDKDGFFKRLSSGVNDLVGVAEKVINDTIRVLSAMAVGSLTETIGEDYAGSFGKLKDDANSTVAKLTEVVGNIQSSSTSVKTGADEISQGNANLSQRTEEQASSLEETASSMEQMTSTVKQNADNAGEANQLAMAAREQAEKGGAVVSQAVEAMNEINASSKKISDIIGVIDEIAFQTNLLALNASVEAARAGDQGRGFAVVASEVRNLAGRSATAAKEIKELIEDSGGKVDEGSRLVNESGKTLEDIVNGVKKVTDIVGEIAAASQEQSAGIDEVNKAIVQMDELTQQNAALVEQAAAASESLGEQADDLNQMMDFFTVAGNGADAKPAAAGLSQGGAERRSGDRPWSAPKAAEAGEEVAAPAAPRKKAAAGAGDQDWEEF